MYVIVHLVDCKVWIKTQVVVFIAICSQLLLAIIFALAYEIGLGLELGGFKQPATTVDIFYFSLTQPQPKSGYKMMKNIKTNRNLPNIF